MDQPAPSALERIGLRIRHLREQQGWSRAELAQRSGISPRFLADVEHGAGNLSLRSLIALADALPASLTTLVTGCSALRDPADQLASLPAPAQQRALRAAAAPDKIALVGLRGAGKSTVGALLSAQLGCPFVEVDAEIEKAAGLPLGSLFEIHGAARYRQWEHLCVTRLLAQHGPLVLATGGSIVTATETWALLRSSARTVWLRATPEAHLARVLSQGDQRPVEGRADALSELRAILAHREPFYGQAEQWVETEVGVEEVVGKITATR